MEFENNNINNEQPVPQEENIQTPITEDGEINVEVTSDAAEEFADEAVDVEAVDEEADEEAVDVEVDDEQENKSVKKTVLKEIMDWVVSIAVAAIIAFGIRTYVFTLVKVDGNSMLPTLHHGETLYTNRLFYQPKNGDIIIFHPRHNPKVSYVKRVIAVEGQTVYIDPETKKVSVDGVVLDEPYIDGADTNPGITGTTFLVPEDHVFVLGDNRNNSSDSRDPNVGFVSEDSILGNAVFRLLPLSQIGTLD